MASQPKLKGATKKECPTKIVSRSRTSMPKRLLESKSMPFTRTNDDFEDTQSVQSNTMSTATDATVIDVCRTGREIKGSYSSLTSFQSSENGTIRQWLTKKEEERKKKQLAQMKIKEQEEIRKQEIVEMERRTFQHWLEEKMQQSKLKKDQKTADTETEQLIGKLKQLEKQKQQLENEERFKYWVQRKGIEDKKKKRNQELQASKEKEERERKIQENSEAYQRWLKQSKYKPKPIRSNQGLDSLRSAVSVGYINPIPWVPNIDPSSLED